jgi:predicted RNA binding protein YcfA (HicA-like mRNA interferase family)
LPDVGRIPPLKPREVEKLLLALGFVEVRQRGSHRQYRHPDGRSTTVPFHVGQDVSPTLIRKIARDIRVDVEEFVAGR